MIDDDRVYKALAHPFRRQILNWLKAPEQAFPRGHIDFNRGVPSNAIHARSGLSQSTVSGHIAILVDAQLLASTRMGQWVLLSRNEPAISDFAKRIELQL